MEEINFFNEEIKFDLINADNIRKWITSVVKSEHSTIETINYIFCSDEYLLKVNQEYLNHDYYTDIITFDNSEIAGAISSDIFISIDRVEENANINQSDFDNELHRVMIHGVLHLVGYKDKTDEDKIIMRAKEDAYISLLS